MYYLLLTAPSVSHGKLLPPRSLLCQPNESYFELLSSNHLFGLFVKGKVDNAKEVPKTELNIVLALWVKSAAPRKCFIVLTMPLNTNLLTEDKELAMCRILPAISNVLLTLPPSLA